MRKSKDTHYLHTDTLTGQMPLVPDSKEGEVIDQSSFTLWASASPKMSCQEMTWKGSSAPDSPEFYPKKRPSFILD